MSKHEKIRSHAEALARDTLGPKTDEKVVKNVADKIYRALPKHVRETA